MQPIARLPRWAMVVIAVCYSGHLKNCDIMECDEKNYRPWIAQANTHCSHCCTTSTMP